jgi:hypothetical protein
MTTAQNPEPEDQTTDTLGGPDPSSSREDELAEPNAGVAGPDTFGGPDPSSSREDELAEPDAGVAGPDTFGGPDRGEEDELRPDV